MQLNLRNPLIFFDLETTGINIVKDRIVEISYVKVFPNGKEESKTLRINPGMPIPPESTAIHGITDEDVKDCPLFKDVAKTLAAQFEGCDLAGFNSNRFDIPLLAEEFLIFRAESLSTFRLYSIRWNSALCLPLTNSIVVKVLRMHTQLLQTQWLHTKF